MCRHDGRPTACKRITDEVTGSTAVREHLGDQLDRLSGRMQIAGHGPIHLEHRIVRAVVDKIVRTVLDPSVEDRLLAGIVLCYLRRQRLAYPHLRLVSA